MGIFSSAAVSSKDEKGSTHKSSAQSFGKLKAQKVRALSRKLSRVSAGNASGSLGLEDTRFGGSDILDSEPEHVQKTNSGLFRLKRSLPRAPGSQYVRDRVGDGEEKLTLNRSTINSEYGSQEEMPMTYENEFEADKRDVSAPRVAGSASLGGWHRAVHIEKSTYGSRDIQRGKFSLESGFFSKKKFSDLGYSEDVVQSLRSQCYVRPSHIQVYLS